MTMFCIIRLDAHFGTNPQNLKIQHFWYRPICLQSIDAQPWKQDSLYPLIYEQAVIIKFTSILLIVFSILLHELIVDHWSVTRHH